MSEPIVVQAQDPERERLEHEGWVAIARSFGAQLDADRVDRARLGALTIRDDVSIRALGPDDVPAVIELDRRTIADYPGSVATQHHPLSREAAAPSSVRRAFGAIDASGELIAMTFVDFDGSHVETDFTVVDPGWRGRGIATAVKAASVIALVDDGAERFRTGGSEENVGILRANAALGYVRDEEWVTLTHP
jgi:GNAT superfamily N-acetyltransferase